MIHENNLPAFNLLKIILTGIFGLFVNAGINAQNEYIPEEITQSLYGTPDKLVNGTIYFPLHPKATGEPYYPYPDYREGSIFIGGEEFDNELIKYDIELQQLVLKKKLNNGAEPEILLFNNRIDSFSFGNRVFINSKFISDSLSEKGFYELLYRGNNLYVGYHKIYFNSAYDRNNPFGKYHNPNKRYYRIEENRLIKFSNKRQFIDLFDPHQTEVRKFIKKNHIKFRKINSAELKRLIKYSEELS